MRKGLLYLLLTFIFGMAGGIFADQIFWPYFVNRPLFEKYNLEQPPVYVIERKEVVIQENTALQDAVEKVAKTVVGVRTKLVSGGAIEGSGMVATNDGLIITLSSLAPSGSRPSFFIEAGPQVFQVLRRDAKADLALVKLEANNLVTTGFTDFSKLKLGQRVFLISYRLRNKSWQKSVNEGVIKTFNGDRIETSIVEKNGFLGSPLFDIEGNLVGLAVAGPDNQVEALPVSKIKALLNF